MAGRRYGGPTDRGCGMRDFAWNLAAVGALASSAAFFYRSVLSAPRSRGYVKLTSVLALAENVTPGMSGRGVLTSRTVPKARAEPTFAE